MLASFSERILVMFSGTNLCRRIWSFLLGAAFAIGLIVYGAASSENIVPYIIIGICGFCTISCLIFGNNCVGDVIAEIFSWSFVKLPGLIFTLDLDGIIWFLTVKLLFFVLGIILAILIGILALIVGGIVSVFVYPFALVKNLKNCEVD